MKALYAFVAFLLILGTVSAEVKKGTKDNFDELIKGDLVLVKFYAPWCGHCKNLAPEYEKAAADLKDEASLIEVDCTENEAVCSKFEVKGYPTLIIFRKGAKSSDYDGPRDAAGIATYIRGMVGPAVKNVANAKELEDLMAKGPVCVVKSASADSDLSKAIASVADQLRTSITFAAVADKDIAADVAMESIAVYRNKDEKESFSGASNSGEITKFIKMSLIPYFGEINPGTYRMYAEQTAKPTGWLFLSKDSKPELKESMVAVAKSVRKDMILLWIDADKYGSVGQQMALPKDVKYPAFVIDLARTHYVMPAATEVTEKSIAAFIEQYLKGEVAATILSEPVPEKETVDGLTTLVGSTFPQHLKANKDTFILFHAPWCGHCKSLRPTYKDLAKKFEKAEVVIAEIDATANGFDRNMFTVQGFPTLYFVPAGKAPVAYEGERTIEALTSFVKKHATSAVAEDGDL